ncbi:hypothetical protein WJX77_009718 [Trebouxia sp. C0004]
MATSLLNFTLSSSIANRCSQHGSQAAGRVSACRECLSHVKVAQKRHRHFKLFTHSTAADKTGQKETVDGPLEGSKSKFDHDLPAVPSTVQGTGTRVAISLLHAYQDYISPLLPSVCCFQPSCSTYSVEAYQQFGARKGTILMVWRLLRCNPFRGGYQGQYDPPSWPPVVVMRCKP